MEDQFEQDALISTYVVKALDSKVLYSRIVLDSKVSHYLFC